MHLLNGIRDHVEFMSRDKTIWVADNTAYVSEQEPYEAYVTEWVAGPANGSLSGKLYGLKDGEPSVPFWIFAEYWDPETQTVRIEQFGWGAVGKGALYESDSALYMLTDQVFHGFDGTQIRTGHKSSKPDENTHETISYDIDSDGEWNERRTYVWKRQPRPE